MMSYPRRRLGEIADLDGALLLLASEQGRIISNQWALISVSMKPGHRAVTLISWRAHSRARERVIIRTPAFDMQ